jgi:hypothetical protein
MWDGYGAESHQRQEHMGSHWSNALSRCLIHRALRKPITYELLNPVALNRSSPFYRGWNDHHPVGDNGICYS